MEIDIGDPRQTSSTDLESLDESGMSVERVITPNYEVSFGIPFADDQSAVNTLTGIEGTRRSPVKEFENSPLSVSAESEDSEMDPTSEADWDGEDESSGIDSPAMKRVKTTSPGFIGSTKQLDFDRRVGRRGFNRGEDESLITESKVRYYANPYYVEPPLEKTYERAVRFGTYPLPPPPESEKNNKIPTTEDLVDLYVA